MKFIISAIVGDDEQTAFECDTLPFVPNVGDEVTLVTQDGPALGVVTSRRFHYFSKGDKQSCSVRLFCDHAGT
jgi:hypothetical protein